MSVTETGKSKSRVDWKSGVERLRLTSRRRWFGSAFLAAWLALWAWGGGKAVILHLQEPMTAIWLVVWMLGLFSIAVLLMGQLAGVDDIRVFQGELVITRRAGPLARTWRYRTGMIKNLRIDMSEWSGEDVDGAQYVPFIKQQWGTVRFDHGAETVHLAPHVDAPEAAQIADWLRRRLPVSAS